MFAAISLMTESSDRYTFLIEHNDTIEDILSQLYDRLGDELAYVCDRDIELEHGSNIDESEYRDKLELLINKVYEDTH